MRKQPSCYQNQYNLVVVQKFGQWLRDHRKKLGLFQSDIAKRASVSTSYISTLERAQPHSITGAELTPERSKVVAIAKAVVGDLNEALMLCGYASLSDAQTQIKVDSDIGSSLLQGLGHLPPDRQEIARKQIRSIIETLSETNGIPMAKNSKRKMPLPLGRSEPKRKTG